jgi:hypothetical protein
VQKPMSARLVTLQMALAFIVLTALPVIATAAGPSAPMQPVSHSSAFSPAADQECQELWDSYGGFFSERDFSVLSGCFRTDSGEWFLADGPDDPRLVDGPVLTSEELSLLAEAQEQLMSEIDALFRDSYCLGTSTINRIYSLTGPTKHPVRGYRSEGTQGFHEEYFETLNRCMQSPQYRLANDYIVWLYERKFAAFPPSVCETLVPPQCAVLENVFQFGWAPWPWDLEDPINLYTYLKEQVLPLVETSPPSSSAGSERGIQIHSGHRSGCLW